MMDGWQLDDDLVYPSMSGCLCSDPAGVFLLFCRKETCGRQ